MRNWHKLDFDINTDISHIFNELKTKYSSFKINLIDGLKIDFNEGWVHLRRSNTEPIIRIYAESSTKQKADDLANNFIDQINKII